MVKHKSQTHMIVRVPVPYRTIADNLVAAFESSSGSHYWCGEAAYRGNLPIPEKAIWYDTPELLIQEGMIFEVHFDDPKKPEGNLDGKRYIYANDITRGLVKMSKKSPVTFGHMIAQIGDALTADVMLQYIVLGEVIYG
jgi:hypothetical protein